MKTYYIQSTEEFAINGVQAIATSDEHHKQLDKSYEWLDENSKEVQAYKAEVQKRNAIAALQVEDAAILKEIQAAQIVDFKAKRNAAKKK